MTGGDDDGLTGAIDDDDNKEMSEDVVRPDETVGEMDEGMTGGYEDMRNGGDVMKDDSDEERRGAEDVDDDDDGTHEGSLDKRGGGRMMIRMM